jgi:hypothetical protein
MLLLSAAALAGCASNGDSNAGAGRAGNRPSTDARLRFLTPTPDATEPPNFNLALDLTGARVTTVTSGKLTRDEGHIHVTLDGKLISMAYGTTQGVSGVAPGKHSLQAEFVAKDHAPFENRPRAFVSFAVQPGP